MAHNFQSESKHSGDEFENLVENDLKLNGFIIVEKNRHIKGTGCEVDFVVLNSMLKIEYIEAKGGKNGPKKRPGAKRTDNVKKAIANAALIKSVHSSTYYVVYFSAKPKKNSYSEEMIQTALDNGIVDEVRYIY